MRVSVIIPTLNAEKYISDLLDSLQNQTVRPFEILVVDSTSEDRTASMASNRGATVLSIERRHFDHGKTRNLAAAHASGEVLVFMTQDAIPADDSFIERIAKPFADEKVAAVGGRQVAYPDAHILERMNREFNYPTEPMKKSLADIKRFGIKTFFLSNVCAAYRASVFRELQGFVEPIVSNEDMIMAARMIEAGHVIMYAPEAKVVHSHNYSLKQLFTRYFDIGGSLQLHNWILAYARAEGEGFRLIRRQLSYLKSPSEWRWLPRLAAETVVKYAGYRMGLVHHKLPSKLRKKCSMHPFFWDRVNSTKTVGGVTINE
ncbi:glycosyltransferase [Cohnella yongneupensis]|uniref:Glycosyltransferase n=1 Tax=Cohnella yongneupensis TaxID=425006 RepID=A0ABW0R1N3_9BACL